MMLLDLASWFFLMIGAFFSVVGGIGIIRMPEFFSRLHGAGITDTMGAGGILIGLLFQAGLSLAAVKLVMILFFLLITSPSSCHALARSALTHGVHPILETRRDD